MDMRDKISPKRKQHLGPMALVRETAKRRVYGAFLDEDNGEIRA